MGCTALHVAAFNKKIEITHFLIDNGIDYNIQTKVRGIYHKDHIHKLIINLNRYAGMKSIK